MKRCLPLVFALFSLTFTVNAQTANDCKQTCTIDKIVYETAFICGEKVCTKAMLTCNYEDASQIHDSLELLDRLGLDDNVSLARYVNSRIN